MTEKEQSAIAALDAITRDFRLNNSEAYRVWAEMKRLFQEESDKLSHLEQDAILAPDPEEYEINPPRAVVAHNAPYSELTQAEKERYFGVSTEY